VGLWDDFEHRFAGGVAYVEVRAALAAARRSGRISPRAFAKAKRKFEEHWADIRVVAIDPAIVRKAGEVAENHALRGYDAIHLATALNLRSNKDDVLMATWDDSLADAAYDAGISVVRTTS
jgi:hypothetical protein